MYVSKCAKMNKRVKRNGDTITADAIPMAFPHPLGFCVMFLIVCLENTSGWLATDQSDK